MSFKDNNEAKNKKSDIKEIVSLKYLEACLFLQAKYGLPKYHYFANAARKSVNKKNSRVQEGLFIHHIDEYRAINISINSQALAYPWEYQKKERLVYCNYLEHLALHYLITEEYYLLGTLAGKHLGVTGLIYYLLPNLNDFFNNKEYTKKNVQYLNIAKNTVLELKEDFLALKNLIMNSEGFLKYVELFMPENDFPQKLVQASLAKKVSWIMNRSFDEIDPQKQETIDKAPTKVKKEQNPHFN